MKRNKPWIKPSNIQTPCSTVVRVRFTQDICGTTSWRALVIAIQVARSKRASASCGRGLSLVEPAPRNLAMENPSVCWRWFSRVFQGCVDTYIHTYIHTYSSFLWHYCRPPSKHQLYISICANKVLVHACLWLACLPFQLRKLRPTPPVMRNQVNVWVALNLEIMKDILV